jgi:hypothetical protein
MQHRKGKRTPRLVLIIAFALLALCLSGEDTAPGDLNAQIYRELTGRQFNFVNWELKALGRKLAHNLVAPQHYMDETARKTFLLDYLQLVADIQRLDREIDRTFTDPDIADPVAATSAARGQLAELRKMENDRQLIAEAIIEEQVASMLTEEGFSFLGQVSPPLSVHFTSLPLLLVISPREQIERSYSLNLTHGLNTAEQEAIEGSIDGKFDVSSLVTNIGGLSAYPAMLLESSSLDWLFEVTAHEWTHYYLTPHKLGWNYDTSGETRTMNETVANIVGKEISHAVIARYYPEHLSSDELQATPSNSEDESETPVFDFRAEMRKTRMEADRLLAGGEIVAAENYMEARRQTFVENGYWIRKLNQAYFAFHGAYADEPGAAGEDPVGPAVRKFRAQSPDLYTFVLRISRITTLAELQMLLSQD